MRQQGDGIWKRSDRLRDAQSSITSQQKQQQIEHRTFGESGNAAGTLNTYCRAKWIVYLRLPRT